VDTSDGQIQHTAVQQQQQQQQQQTEQQAISFSGGVGNAAAVFPLSSDVGANAAAEAMMYDPFAAAASMEFNAGSSNMASAVAAVLRTEQLLPPPPLHQEEGFDSNAHIALCEVPGTITGPPCTITGDCSNAGSGSGVGDAALLASFRCQLQAEGSVSGEMPLSAAPTLSSTFSM
jgi:hypothetical protein